MAPLVTSSLVDWSNFWKREHVGEDWEVEPFLARGRGHALNAKGGDGKSLLFQECALAIATGRPVLYRAASDPLSVLYVDMEMTEEDLHERLSDFGYSEKDDLSNLHYLLLPDLPPLDTHQGGLALAEAVKDLHADVVFIDTLARAVEGEEDKADTIRRFYRHSGLRLKQLGATWARADHLGKDPSLGGRGTSAKNDDVDVVWQMSVTRAGKVTLTAKKRRMRWIPEEVVLQRTEEPWTRHCPADRVIPPDMLRLVADLNSLGVPLDLGRTKVRGLLQAAGLTARNDALSAAIRFRREHGLK